MPCGSLHSGVRPTMSASMAVDEMARFFYEESQKRHNKTVLEELEVGDMIEFPSDLYSHWGVYIGDEQIVHLTGDQPIASGSFSSVSGIDCDQAWVRIDKFLDVAKGRFAKKNNDKDSNQRAAGRYPRPSDDIVRTALALTGEADYNVFFNNCEHFASYLRYGEKCSEQADTALTAVVVGGAAVIVGSLLGSLFNRKK